MSKKITVCLPTYNRATYIERQLTFFLKEIENTPEILEHIDFIVADNASQDETPQLLKKWHSESSFFKLQTNKENLGLIGNIISLRDLCNTEYVWFVSDDDILKEGILVEILKTLNEYKNLEYIFLNFSLFDKKAFNGKPGYRIDGKKAALEVYRETYGSLVFMTSCIYKKQNLLEIANKPMSTWLAAPLFYSLYSCSKNHIFITNDVWIDFTPNNASYAGFKSNSKLKFEQYVPILERIVDFGYSKKEVDKTIRVFFERQSHAHILYNFINLFKSIRLYKYYSLRTIHMFPKNIINYIK